MTVTLVLLVAAAVLARSIHVGLALICGALVALLAAGVLGLFDPAPLMAFPIRLLGLFDNSILAAVPLVYLMAELSESAKPPGGMASRAAPAPSFPVLALASPFPALLFLLGDRLGDALQAAQVAQGVFASDALGLPRLLAALAVTAVTFFARPMLAEFRAGKLPAKSLPSYDAMRVQAARWAPSILLLAAIALDVATPVEAAGFAVLAAVLAAAGREGVRPAVVIASAAALLVLLALRSFVDLRVNRLIIPPTDRIAVVVALICLALLVVGAALAIGRLLQVGWFVPALERAAARSADLFLLLAGATAAILVLTMVGVPTALAGILGRLPSGIAWFLTLAGGGVTAAAAGWRTATVLYLPVAGAALLSRSPPATPSAAVLLGALFWLSALSGIWLSELRQGDRSALGRLASALLAGIAVGAVAWLAPGVFGGGPSL